MTTIIVNRAELASAVTFAAAVLPKRAVVPVLEGIRVTVNAGRLELAAFDYETSARVTVDGQGGGNAVVLVNGKELAAVVKSLPKGRNVTAEVTAEADGLIVVCGGVEALLSSLPLEEYPQLPEVPAETGVMDAATFARSVTRVAACAGTDDTLPALTCVKMAGEDGALLMVATDRYRLAVDRPAWTGPDGVSTLVPASALVRFAKAASKTGKVSLHISEEFAGFSDGTRTMTVRPCLSEFPKRIHRDFIADPSEFGTMVLADAKTVHDAVVRAGKMTGKGERMGFAVTSGTVTVNAVKDGQACGTERVTCETDGPDAPAGFCAAYLASALAGFTGDVWMGIKVEDDGRVTRPVQLRADGDTLAMAVCVIRLPA